jgi:hypothetical protein
MQVHKQDGLVMHDTPRKSRWADRTTMTPDNPKNLDGHSGGPATRQGPVQHQTPSHIACSSHATLSEWLMYSRLSEILNQKVVSCKARGVTGIFHPYLRLPWPMSFARERTPAPPPTRFGIQCRSDMHVLVSEECIGRGSSGRGGSRGGGRDGGSGDGVVSSKCR